MENKKPNCTVTIEQRNGNVIDQCIFIFDDYRVAIALSNILCNLEYVDIKAHTYKDVEEKEKN